MRPDEIVMEAEKLDMIGKSVLPTSMRQRATGEIRGALPDRQVKSLDEGRVEGRGVLRLGKRLRESPRYAENLTSFDSDDPIVPPSLQHLTVNAGDAEEAPNNHS